MSAGLTDDEYTAALGELAEYEKRIAQAGRLEQADTMAIAATLDRLYHDQRWVEERNAHRAETAKTARGGRPVDPTSRSQFSTWVRDRYRRFAPSRTYQLLDAYQITGRFLPHVEVTPTQEAQLRPLKSLLSRANGEGARIPEVWDMACKAAADEFREPTGEDVKAAIREWRALHLPPAVQRKERAEDRAWLKERKAVAAWKELVRIGGHEHIQAFLDIVQKDVEQFDETGDRP
jgi:hypothetical protein